MKRLLIAILIIFFCAYVSVSAQTLVTVSGRVTTKDGQGVYQARIHFFRLQLDNNTIVTTNNLGYYSFTQAWAGFSYHVMCQSKQGVCSPDYYLVIIDSIKNLNFVLEDNSKLYWMLNTDMTRTWDSN